jgi:hypothetical protein
MARARAAHGVHRDARRGAGDLRRRARSAATGGTSWSHRARPSSTRLPRRSCATSTATTSPAIASTIRGTRSTGGRKRWASAASVCSRVSRKQAYPGDEGTNYSLNPGEAWAEVYRLLDERKAGHHDGVVADRRPELLPRRGRSRRRGTGRRPAVGGASPAASSREPSGSGQSVSGGSRSRRRSTATSGSARPSRAAAPARSRSPSSAQPADGPPPRAVGEPAGEDLDASVCGQRSMFVRVTQKGLVGEVRVSVTTA